MSSTISKYLAKVGGKRKPSSTSSASDTRVSPDSSYKTDTETDSSQEKRQEKKKQRRGIESSIEEDMALVEEINQKFDKLATKKDIMELNREYGEVDGEFDH